MSSGMSHYKVLGVLRTATDDEIRMAYRKKALSAHPDKGGSTALFNRLQLAYDTLKDPKLRSKYDEETLQEKRRKRFQPPPKVEGMRMPETFALPDGSLYAFETAPDRLRCKFRHGDVVRHTDGEQGTFIGMAGNGVLYWAPSSQSFAVPLNTFGGERDIQVLYRNVVAPRASRAAPTAAGAAPPKASNNDSAEQAARRHAAEEEKLAKQRSGKIARELKQLEAEEQIRRDTILRAVEKHLAAFHADITRTMALLEKHQQAEAQRTAQSVSPLAVPTSGSPHKNGVHADPNANDTDVDTAAKYRKTTPRSWHPQPAVSPSLAYRSVAPRPILLGGGAKPKSTTTPRFGAASGVDTPPPTLGRGRDSAPNTPQSRPQPGAHPLSPPSKPLTPSGSFSSNPRTGTPVNVRVNNAYLHRRDSCSTSFHATTQIDQSMKEEYDKLVQEALNRRAATPSGAQRRTPTPNVSRQATRHASSPTRAPNEPFSPPPPPSSSENEPTTQPATAPAPAPARPVQSGSAAYRSVSTPVPGRLASASVRSRQTPPPSTAHGGMETPRGHHHTTTTAAPKLSRVTPTRA